MTSHEGMQYDSSTMYRKKQRKQNLTNFMYFLNEMYGSPCFDAGFQIKNSKLPVNAITENTSNPKISTTLANP